MWWCVFDSVCVCVCVCVAAKVRGDEERERERESLSANTGHEKCMEVAVSVCWSESCRERAQTGFSELWLSALSLTWPPPPRLSFSTAHFISPARPHRQLCFTWAFCRLALIVNILFFPTVRPLWYSLDTYSLCSFWDDTFKIVTDWLHFHTVLLYMWLTLPSF